MHPMALPFAQADVDAEGLSEAIDGQGVTAGDWVTAGIILGSAFLLAWVAGMIIDRLLKRFDATPGAILLMRRLLRYAMVLAGFVYALNAVGVRIGPLLGALGIAGIALAFALQDILENFVAGILIQVRRPFRVGDQIMSGEHEGTVHEVNARTVVLDTPDGERVHLPAGAVIKDAMENLTVRGRRRTTLDIGVDYGADLTVARSVLVEAAAGCGEVSSMPPPEALVHEFADSSILIALRFWHEPTIAGMWAARDAVAVAAKRALDAEGIGIPFPQSVVTFASGIPEGDDQAD